MNRIVREGEIVLAVELEWAQGLEHVERLAQWGPDAPAVAASCLVSEARAWGTRGLTPMLDGMDAWFTKADPSSLSHVGRAHLARALAWRLSRDHGGWSERKMRVRLLRSATRIGRPDPLFDYPDSPTPPRDGVDPIGFARELAVIDADGLTARRRPSLKRRLTALDPRMGGHDPLGRLALMECLAWALAHARSAPGGLRERWARDLDALARAVD